ncbi:RluA family pseudouridine synthase [Spirulina sp. CCNP1310]|uniref:RluA family pseudouridine synthase n=1 Tax=Spirulina sp. CCNP1310 TaxID=3110249 RepID=UPI002B1FDA85|nr:RluA family pseudouridine synthase [Spirulina sp. CCNP1310]MEA5418383.1 RluA family pseudouridine synthase [Spirulina sp. CCNP1310]
MQNPPLFKGGQGGITLTVSEPAPRLDRWLAAQIPDLSRSRLQKLIEQGQVQRNGSPCTEKKTGLQPGDSLTLTIPPLTGPNLEPEAIPLDILYEDPSLIIINKAAGMVVHPAPGHSQGTLVHALLHHCQDLAGIGGEERPGIVHRLDKDTSGVMVVAKTEQALHHLQAQIKAKTAQRIYHGIVYGAPRDQQGTVDAPIGHHPAGLKKMAICENGREAVTHWQVLERLGNYTLLEFHLTTGRTHQIRVHLAHIGYALVGDPLYGPGRSLGVNLTGQALHAYCLRLDHPLTGERLEAIAPYPPEFLRLQRVLSRRA